MIRWLQSLLGIDDMAVGLVSLQAQFTETIQSQDAIIIDIRDQSRKNRETNKKVLDGLLAEISRLTERVDLLSSANRDLYQELQRAKSKKIGYSASATDWETIQAQHSEE